jgi:hypothetical protein
MHRGRIALLHWAGLFVITTLTAFAQVDFDHWTIYNSPQNSLWGVATNGSLFVAVGDAGTIMTSADGLTWTIRTSGVTNNLKGVMWSGAQFVAVGELITILTSADGINWTIRSSGLPGSLWSVSTNGNKFVAVGTAGKILSSVDGISWISCSSGTSNSLYGVSWSGNQFTTVGNYGTILTSPDGTTWTSRTSGTVNHLRCVTSNGSLLVATGFNDTILTSPDGMIWTPRTSGTAYPLYGVTWNGSLLVAAGATSSILTSVDGTSWTGHPSGSGSNTILLAVASTRYQCVAVGGGTIVTSLMTPTSAPTIATQPISQTVTAGGNVTFSVTATGSPTPTFQWQKNGVSIAGAATSSLSLTGAQTGDAGNYTVTVTNSVGTVTSNAATLTVNPVVVPSSRLSGLSIRTNAGTGDQTLIAGFIVSGDSKSLLIRGVGPTLGQYGVTGYLTDPLLKLFNGPTQCDTNDNWSTAANASQVAATAAQLQDFTLPAASLDAALLSTLNNGTYTAQVSGASSATGIALVEVYDANFTATSKLTGVSARSQVGTGDNILIAGFVITGNAKKTVLIRGVGPALTPMGVAGALADPQLTVKKPDGTTLASNDNWSDAANATQVAATAAQLQDFPLPAGSKDAALLLTLDPGLYSAQVSGVNATTGVALVEVYEMP